MNRFKEQRLAHGYKTQAELAAVLFVNQTAVSQWERGVTTPSPTLLVKLSNLYGVSTDYLLGNAQTPKRNFWGKSKRGCVKVVEPKKQSPKLDDDDIRAAFFEGAEDLSEEEMKDLWDDAKDYIKYKMEQRRKRDDK